MKLWSGSGKEFIESSLGNSLAQVMTASFFQKNRYRPGDSEIESWRNSLRQMASVLQRANLEKAGVILEYQLPASSKRLDCMVVGVGRDGAHTEVIELKQWETCQPSTGENEVVAFVGGGLRDVLHPSVQVLQYKRYLADFHSAFGTRAISSLNACGYLHNYNIDSGDHIRSEKFQNALAECPVFGGDESSLLVDRLGRSFSTESGMDLLAEIEQAPVGPSKQFLNHVASTVAGMPEYVLLDEQLVAFDKVKVSVREAIAVQPQAENRKNVIIITGGPGTGKSVVAMNLLGSLAQDGFRAEYATGSRAFRETLRKVLGYRVGQLATYFNAYTDELEDSLDAIICDEAHRIRASSRTRYNPNTNYPQIEELIRVAKLPVFLLDDAQVVKPDEIGTVDYIRENAERLGCNVEEYDLPIQFRCRGSAGFVRWIDNTLGVKDTANVIWTGHEGFEFGIVDTPLELEEIIRQRTEGNSARMTAGFCWPWSNPRTNGTLVEDVIIGDYRRPWNAKSWAREPLAEGIPKETLWAHDPMGINQIGCVYTAQGFEFDYVGVIVGLDMTYDLDKGCWVGNKSASHDSQVRRANTDEEFLSLTKNTYRVLLSRGMKGCFVCFLDRDTKRFFRSRLA